ncbi:hypothetical protein [Streptomyces sp. NPDC002671]
MGFDLFHAGADLTGWPYERRRAALQALFADHGLEAPLTLCPSTTDPAVARGWLEWAAAGVEGLCFKRMDEPYRPVRSSPWAPGLHPMRRMTLLPVTRSVL